MFGFAGVMVFLFLAALYESWSIPFAVVLAVPLGLFGALLAVYLREVRLRHLHADRHRDADRPGGEERDPDRRVRDGCGASEGMTMTRRRSRPRISGCGRF